MKLDRDQISRHQYLLFTASWRPSLLLNAGGFKKRETLVKTEAEHANNLHFSWIIKG